MAARLGRALYWTGCIIGGLLVILAIAFLFAPGQGSWFRASMSACTGVVAWLIGWACRYVLVEE